jgi:hypothetical protein
MAVDSLTLLPVLLCTMGHNCFIASKYPKLVSERPVSGKYFYSYELPFWVGNSSSQVNPKGRFELPLSINIVGIFI